MSVVFPYSMEPRNGREAILLSTLKDRISLLKEILWMPAFVYGLQDVSFITRPTLLYKSATKTYIVDARDDPDYNFSDIYPWLVYIRMETDVVPDLPEINEAVNMSNEIQDGKIFDSKDDYRILFDVLRRAFVDLNQPMSNIRINHIDEVSDSKVISSVTVTFTGAYNDIVTGLYYSDGNIFIIHNSSIRLYARIKLI